MEHMGKTEYGSHQSKNGGNQMDSGKNQPSSTLLGFFPGLTFPPPGWIAASVSATHRLPPHEHHS